MRRWKKLLVRRRHLARDRCGAHETQGGRLRPDRRQPGPAQERALDARGARSALRLRRDLWRASRLLRALRPPLRGAARDARHRAQPPPLAQALGYELDDLRPDHGLSGLAARLPAPGVALPVRYVVGLHGTSRADKEWPAADWKRLGLALAGAGRPLVLPWGNDTERLRAQDIAAAVPGTMVLPRLGLDALAVIIDRAEAVVGVDTGPMHLAAGLGKPGLALYTATRDRH